ncbi:Very short patch repair protein [compost metagenome]
MTDVLSPVQRKYCMSRVRSKNTKPELLLRKKLWAAGFRYRLSVKLPGSPDLVFLKSKVAVFVDGCFWHGCPLHATQPETNSAFWFSKLSNNKKRDERINSQLAILGWSVLRIWEHEIEADVELCVGRVGNMLKQK